MLYFLQHTVTKTCEFHRVVQDESHLFGKGNSARIDYANAIRSSLRWGVTATPCTSSATELTKQLSFINGSQNLSNGDFTSLQEAIQRFHSRPSQTTLNLLVDRLQTFIILHTKSQRINGSAALSLPPSTTSTVLLTLSRDEDVAFNFSECFVPLQLACLCWTYQISLTLSHLNVQSIQQLEPFQRT